MTNHRTVAAVDIGTNSVKMTVARRSADGVLNILFDETVITRLGKGVDSSGRITDEAAERTLSALAAFGGQARGLGAQTVAAVGTSALRDATNGAEIVAEAERRMGGTVEIIAGAREAGLTYRAARNDADIMRAGGIAGAALFITSDIGGGSTEIVQGVDADIIYAESLQIGAVRLSERAGLGDPVTGEAFQAALLLANAALADVPTPPAALAPVLVASGGTAANLAAMEIAARGEAVTFDAVHASRLTREQIESRAAFLASLPLAERRKVPGLEPDRADVIVAGAIIQARVMARLGTDSLLVSLRGLRYGLLYEQAEREQETADMRAL
ncbi:MAG: Ppx/GppA family phosphatase [Akkermansiaceae bacterium]|nr:Ppx/GppA family phosphatase [Armatimonadota bacterium]